MELRQVEYVVGVIDHGGFTRAAAELHVTQPSLSQGIRTLEAELGLPLFHRLGRSVALTSAGAALPAPPRPRRGAPLPGRRRASCPATSAPPPRPSPPPAASPPAPSTSWPSRRSPSTRWRASSARSGPPTRRSRCGS